MQKRLLHLANGEVSHLGFSEIKLSYGVPIFAGQERFRILSFRIMEKAESRAAG